MDVGPAMHLDDLVATKVAALVSRREVRDYIDVAAEPDADSPEATARGCRTPGLG
jgi:hypothetical protein